MYRFNDGNRNPYTLIYDNDGFLWCPDAFHLLKIQRNRIVNNTICPGFSLQRKALTPDDLKKLLPDCPKDCFEQDKKFKMRDEIALRLFSKENINTLFANQETAVEAIYWLLHYPLCQMLVKMESYEFQRLIVFCLYTMIRILNETYAFKKQGGEHAKLAQNRGKNVKFLTGFSIPWMK